MKKEETKSSSSRAKQLLARSQMSSTSLPILGFPIDPKTPFYAGD